MGISREERTRAEAQGLHEEASERREHQGDRRGPVTAEKTPGKGGSAVYSDADGPGQMGTND